MALVRIIQAKQPILKSRKTSTTVKDPTVVVTRSRSKKVEKILSPEEIVPEKFFIGTYVLLGPTTHDNYSYGYGSIIRKDNVPCKVVCTNTSGSVEIGSTQILTLQMPSFSSYRATNFNYPANLLRLISIKDANERIKEVREKFEKVYEASLEAAKKIINTSHVAISKRTDYDLGRVVLDTNFNFLALGKISKDWDFTVTTNNKFQAARCCSLSKTTSDICLWIPKSWIHYMGYNKKDLEAWLDFCTRLEIGFEARVTKEVKLEDIFGTTFQHQAVPNGVNSGTRNLYYLPRTEEAYEVLIKAGSHRMHTYLYFILVRYIYNQFYYTLPFIAMQLKLKLKDKASFWECLLLAHNNISASGSYRNYYGYYCLTATQDRKVVLANQHNTQKKVLARLISGTDMNGSFTYTDGSAVTLTDAIRKGTNEEILKIIEEVREK